MMVAIFTSQISAALTPLERVNQMFDDIKHLDKPMTQADGRRTCAALGDRWSLPDMQEAHEIMGSWKTHLKLKDRKMHTGGLASAGNVSAKEASAQQSYEMKPRRPQDLVVQIGTRVKFNAGDVKIVRADFAPYAAAASLKLDIVCVRPKAEFAMPPGYHLTSKTAAAYVNKLAEKTSNRCEQMCIYEAQKGSRGFDLVQALPFARCMKTVTHVPADVCQESLEEKINRDAAGHEDFLLLIKRLDDNGTMFGRLSIGRDVGMFPGRDFIAKGNIPWGGQISVYDAPSLDD
jgi:hypothetical protein